MFDSMWTVQQNTDKMLKKMSFKNNNKIKITANGQYVIQEEILMGSLTAILQKLREKWDAPDEALVEDNCA